MSTLFPEEEKVVEIQGYDALEWAIKEYDPSHIFGLFSGGHDSLCACHVASKHPRFSGCVHINTTIGIPETRQFVRDTCQKFRWPLKEYSPPVSYRDIVLKWGFPGPAGHTVIYNRLKERCLRSLIREYKKGFKDRIILVTGVRKAESRRRMGYVETIQRAGATVWVAPIAEWTNDIKAKYIVDNLLPRNPVVDLLGMSGECLCGAFAGSKTGSSELELALIRSHFPEAAAVIDNLEADARTARVPCKWGVPPPAIDDPYQQAILFEGLVNSRYDLCSSCIAQRSG